MHKAGKEKRVNAKRLRRRCRRLRILRVRRQFKQRETVEVRKFAPVEYVPQLKRQAHVLSCPERLNLSGDYEETISFLTRIRRITDHLNGRFYLNLKPLRVVTPAGALMLVAELDRWREITPYKKLGAYDVEKWDPIVRRRLNEMGFFRTLNAACSVDDIAIENEDRYLSFISGHGSEGNAAKMLRESIEQLGPKLADSDSLYNGLVEAMTNVKHHAYKQSEPVRRWWLSASVNVNSNCLTVMFLDHGSSIPSTLPRSDMWEQVRGFCARFGLDFKDDSKLIEAAMRAKRSRTDDEHRGHGLREDIRGYIESHEAQGSLRILSGRGKYVYERDHAAGENTTTVLLPRRLNGTFIEWRVEEYAARETKVD